MRKRFTALAAIALAGALAVPAAAFADEKVSAFGKGGGKGHHGKGGHGGGHGRHGHGGHGHGRHGHRHFLFYGSPYWYGGYGGYGGYYGGYYGRPYWGGYYGRGYGYGYGYGSALLLGRLRRPLGLRLQLRLPVWGPSRLP